MDIGGKWVIRLKHGLPWLQILHGHSAKSFCVLKNDADNISTTFNLFIC